MPLTSVMELTSVSNSDAAAHRGTRVHRYDELLPDREYDFDGLHFRTLPSPGAHLCSFATVNDVHFGETVCGLIEGADVGPVFRVAPGETPYPELMNRAAAEEMGALELAAVVAKGDLTADGSSDQYRAFLDVYGEAFGDRLVHVRGNHDAYDAEHFVPPAPLEVVLDGVRLAVLDTTWPGHAGGRLSARDLEWLDELAARSDRPVLVFGHHPPSDPASADRSRESFLLQPEDSERLLALFGRRPALRGYFAGHTHRNRVRRFAAAGRAPFVEVACVKDFPGAWAEYRVHEGGVLQIVRRISSPEALAWTERTRGMFDGRYAQYAFGALEARCFLIPTR